MDKDKLEKLNRLRLRLADYGAAQRNGVGDYKEVSAVKVSDALNEHNGDEEAAFNSLKSFYGCKI